MKKAIVLLSGGLDSTTTLAIAKSKKYDCIALSFDYGQRSTSEVQAAQEICKQFNITDHRIVHLNINQFGGSALTDHDIAIPTSETKNIPTTYVPARNTIFLSIALGLAEVNNTGDIFIGATQVDYSGYPDCRSEFFDSFTKMAQLATKAGVENQVDYKIHTPLLNLSKKQIIKSGLELGIDYSMTISCYDSDENGLACGVCDSCRQRREGFLALGVEDPTKYTKKALQSLAISE